MMNLGLEARIEFLSTVYLLHPWFWRGEVALDLQPLGRILLYIHQADNQAVHLDNVQLILGQIDKETITERLGWEVGGINLASREIQSLRSTQGFGERWSDIVQSINLLCQLACPGFCVCVCVILCPLGLQTLGACKPQILLYHTLQSKLPFHS